MGSGIPAVEVRQVDGRHVQWRFSRADGSCSVLTINGGEAWRQHEARRAARVESSGCLGLVLQSTAWERPLHHGSFGQTVVLQSTPASPYPCFPNEERICRPHGGAVQHAIEHVVDQHT